MKFEFQIEQSDIQAVVNIINENKCQEFVIERVRRNVEGSLSDVSQEEIWQTQMMCLLTSQQRSGTNSPVSRFLEEKPFQISLEMCKNADSIENFLNSRLMNFGGIRFSNNISKRATANFDKLEKGGWEEIIEWLEKLKSQRMEPPHTSHYHLERCAAKYMSQYEGFGPKQSRNFWQALGLMRYEFVLDSRITAWLKNNQFPVPLSATALGDEGYYLFLSDILRELCNRANVLPCILDAAIFINSDKQSQSA